MLHTSLDGKPGHDPYAPCTVADLARFGYDYWALGHIHADEIVSRDPWIVYPGNPQGRSPRETGAKGAMRVTVEDGRIVEVEKIVLDAARWAHESVDVGGCADEADVLARIGAAIERAHVLAEGRPLAVRITLTGSTPAHARLVAHRERLEEDARALGFQFAADCWVERLRLETRAPSAAREPDGEPDALDVDALVAAAAEEPEFSDIVAELMRTLAEKMPRDLRADVAADDPVAVAARVALARDWLKGERA